MKVRIAPSARSDLRSIYDYIAEDSPFHARQTIERIGKLIDDIGDQPYSGRIVPEFEDPSLRERLYKSYRIIYRIRIDHLEVITIFHTARMLLR
jgi:toxin ParE1/3/4